MQPKSDYKRWGEAVEAVTVLMEIIMKHVNCLNEQELDIINKQAKLIIKEWNDYNGFI